MPRRTTSPPASKPAPTTAKNSSASSKNSPTLQTQRIPSPPPRSSATLAEFFHRKLVAIYEHFDPQLPIADIDGLPTISNCNLDTVTAWEPLCHHHEHCPLGSTQRSLPPPYIQPREQLHQQRTHYHPQHFHHLCHPPSGLEERRGQTAPKKNSSDPAELKTYQPISLLSFPSKVLEKAINIQLTNHLETNKLLDPSQSGFR